MITNQSQPLPTAEQLNEHRQYLKDKIAGLQQQHADTQKQADAYKESGDTDMNLAMNSFAANIWTTITEIQYIVAAFNKIWPDPNPEPKK